MSSLDQYAPPTARSSSVLRREVGLLGLLWASVGSIIGSGWLFGARSAVNAAGPAALLSWLIGFTAVLLLALVHAELGGMFPAAGGTARYPHFAFGGLAGMSFGWFAWLQAATVAPVEVVAMIGYAGHWSWAAGLQRADGSLSPAGFVVAVTLMGLFVAVNFLGVRLLARTNSAATWWKVATPLATILLLSLTHFHVENFTSHGFAPFGAKGVLGAISDGGVIFALIGFEQAIQISGESSNPARDIPRAVVGSLAIGATLYLLLQVAFIAAIPGTAIDTGWAHLSFPGVRAPFAGLAGTLGLGWLAWVLYFDAVVSPAGTGLIYTTSTSRISYGLSRNGYAPGRFAQTDGHGVPWLGLLTSFVVGVVCFLPLPSWKDLVSFSTSASVLMYAGAPLAFGVFRSRLRTHPRPYRLPGGGCLAPAAFVVANLIVYWSGWGTVWRLGFAIVAGYSAMGAWACYAHARKLPRAPRMHWRSATWLPCYLLGMGVISWQGGYGTGATGRIPLWWDLALVTAFSVVIYSCARLVALPASEIRRQIGDLPSSAP